MSIGVDRDRALGVRRWIGGGKSGWGANIGVVIVVCYSIAGLLAPILTSYSQSQIVGAPFELWSYTHPLGTDNLGRDMLTRLLFAIRNTVGISLAATVIAVLVGCSLGLLSAAKGGWFDFLLSRVVDVMMAVPQLIIAMLMLSMLGTSVATLIGVIAAIESTRLFRLSRALGMDIIVMEYVDVARMRGEGSRWIVRSEILPNVVRTLIAEACLRLCFVFLLISALSFMGLGLQPPSADLGSMVRENASLIAYGDITPLIPAAVIGLLVVALNFVADGYLKREA